MALASIEKLDEALETGGDPDGFDELQETIEYMMQDIDRIMAVARDGSLCPELKAEAAAAAGPIIESIDLDVSILREELDR